MIKATEFETLKFKCCQCGKNITTNNVGEHAICLQQAHGFDKEFTLPGLWGMVLSKEWYDGPFGQDAQYTFTMFLKEVEGQIITRDPVLVLTQYALAVQGQPKVRKPKDEPIAPIEG